MMASEPVSSFPDDDQMVTVAAWTTPSSRDSVTALENLPIDTAGGGQVALGKVAKVEIVPTPSQIDRDQGNRMQEVDANTSGTDLGTAAAEVQSLLKSFRLPAGYTASLRGEAVERAAAQRRLEWLGLGALVVIALLPQAAFRSWRLAGMLLITLPMALVGGLLAAWGVLGTIMLGALVGFFTVLGIAARNGILMIAHFRHLEEAEGVPFGRDLVVRGAGERLSPILMTALATALALVPLVVYGNQPGQEITGGVRYWNPLSATPGGEDPGHEAPGPLFAAILTFPSDASQLMSGSCIRRDRRRVFPGQEAGISAVETSFRQSRDLLTCGFFARLMQFPRVRVPDGGRHPRRPGDLDAAQPVRGPRALPDRGRLAPRRASRALIAV